MEGDRVTNPTGKVMTTWKRATRSETYKRERSYPIRKMRNECEVTIKAAEVSTRTRLSSNQLSDALDAAGDSHTNAETVKISPGNVFRAFATDIFNPCAAASIERNRGVNPFWERGMGAADAKPFKHRVPTRSG